MKDGKLIYSLHSHVHLFTVRFPPDRVAHICDKLQSFKLMQLGTGTPNLQRYYSVDRIQFIAGRSCIRNNIINVPAPALAEYKYLSLSRQYIESTKIHLVESNHTEENV